MRFRFLFVLICFLIVSSCHEANKTTGWKPSGARVHNAAGDRLFERSYIYEGPPLCGGESRLAFPVIPRSSQILASGHLLETFNYNDNSFVDAVYGRMAVRCDKIPWKRPVIWKVFSTTEFHASKISFPVVEKGIPWVDLLSTSMFQFSAGICFIICLLCLLLLHGKVHYQLLRSLFLANFFTFWFFVFSIPGEFGLLISMSWCTRLLISSCWLGFIFYFDIFYQLNFISKTVFRIFMALSIVPVCAGLFAVSHDHMLKSTFLGHAGIIIVSFSTLATLLRQYKKVQEREVLINILSLSFFMVFVFHDIALMWGFKVITSGMLLHIGMSSGQVMAFLGLNNRIVAELKNSVQMSKELTRLNNLKEQQKGMLRALEMIAHDIKRPFSSMKALFSVLSKMPESEIVHSIKRFQPDLDRVVEDASRLIDQIGQTECRSDIVFHQVTIAEELEVVVGRQREAYSHKNIGVISNLTGKPVVNIDSNFRYVMENLIENAFDATAKNGFIEVSIDIGSNRMTFAVVNSGSVICEKIRERIFEPFFSTKTNGKGLGLSIVKNIVSKNSGNIEVISDLQSKSTKFLVEVEIGKGFSPPLREEESGSKASFEVPSANIWILDDDHFYQELFERICGGFMKSRIICKKFSSEEVLLNYLASEENPPDMIFCDIDLGCGVKSGLDTIALLNEKLENTKIISHSNRLSQLESHKAIAKGACSFIPKPISGQLLESLLLEFYT